ncbi:MAG: hypothetical protein QOH63_1976 [Acidobacteriota bacterium]|jgi:hypothetical protein|nr:hypothetical protein [Acidobacteriota bacterium]
MPTAKESLIAEQPPSAEVSVPTSLKKKRKGPGDLFLNKLYEKMKETAGETFTQDQFSAAVRYARSHAGGKTKGLNAKPAMAEMSYTRMIEMVNSALCESFKKPFSNESYFYWAREIYPAYVIVCSNDDGKYYQIAYTITDDEVEFDDPVEVEQTFAPVNASEGINIIDLCANGHGVRLFNELQEFATPPDWIPYLPKPGKYNSPRYGEINITEDRIQNFVKNFDDKVYQEKLPIDAEHETKLSGALGWITEMRVNTDGSVDAKAEWTDRGTTLIENDRFKYFSPEWFEEWTDPATEEKHSDVAVGGALTTRPFFKEKALRPLVASERGLEATETEPKDLPNSQTVIFTALAPISKGANSMPSKQQEDLRQAATTKDPDGGGDDDTTATGDTDNSHFDAQGKKRPGMFDADGNPLAKKATEPQSFAELKAELETERAARKASEEGSRKLSERTAAVEKELRTKRFSDTINDATGNGAKRFIGGAEDHLSFMEFIAEHDGETSDRMTKYVEQQRAHAEQVRKSGLFDEVGRSGGDGASSSAQAQLDAKAKALQAFDPQTYPTYALAYDHVYTTETELRQQYREEARGAK